MMNRVAAAVAAAGNANWATRIAWDKFLLAEEEAEAQTAQAKADKELAEAKTAEETAKREEAEADAFAKEAMADGQLDAEESIEWAKEDLEARQVSSLLLH